jgi:hypothetical protein
MRLVEALAGGNAWLAMLCKLSVARKVLEKSWRAGSRFAASIYRIDSRREFGIAVDAGLLVMRFDRQAAACPVFGSLDENEVGAPAFGLVADRLVADAATFTAWSNLLASDAPVSQRWRSGVKHDAADVMELIADASTLRNGLGEAVDLEPDLLYPMLKSSEVSKTPVPPPRRRMLVTQTQVGASTDGIRACAPRTWTYLLRNAARLDHRRSAIYRHRPRFSVFGVGPYTFAPWKVAISGFYKQLEFRVIGPHEGRPVVFDDTVYFLPFASCAEATLVAELLNSSPAQAFLRSLVFWDAKRPVTTELLHQLDLFAVADATGQRDAWVALHPVGKVRQATLFDRKSDRAAGS